MGPTLLHLLYLQHRQLAGSQLPEHGPVAHLVQHQVAMGLLMTRRKSLLPHHLVVPGLAVQPLVVAHLGCLATSPVDRHTGQTALVADALQPVPQLTAAERCGESMQLPPSLPK